MAYLPHILAGTGLLVLLIAQIWLIVLAFQRHIVWGLAVLLIPFASLAFLIVAWDEARRPFFWGVTAVVLLVMAVFTLPEQQRGALANAKGSSISELMTKLAPQTTEPAQTTPEPTTPDSTPPAQPEVFESKLPPPSVPEGQPEKAKPGVFYIVERVSMTTETGVKAVRPGEEVRLLERLPGEKMRVTVGNADFVLRNSQVTDDLTIARAAERRDFELRRQGKL